jgi:hypothetical protein
VNEVTKTSVKVAGEDPIISGMAGRYANALFELALEANVSDGTDLVFKQVMLGPVRTAIFTMANHLPGWMTRVRDLFSASIEIKRHRLFRKMRR